MANVTMFGSFREIDRAQADAMCSLLTKNWWVIALRGAMAVLFGLVALFVPGAAMLSLALLFGAYLLVDGVLGVVSAVRAARHHERWGWLLAEAGLNIVMGCIALAFPAAAVLGFVLVTAAWALLSGGAMLRAAFTLKIDHGRWWMVVAGIVSLIWGVLLVIAPLVGAVVLTWWLGGYAIVFGIMLLVLAFQLRSRRMAAGSQTGQAGAAA